MDAAAEDSALLRSWLALAGMSEDGARELTQARLAELVRAHFDPQLVDQLLERDGEPPAWLHGMLGARRWRQLLCELFEEHSTCTLLQFAMRELCDGEHAAEVASNATVQSVMGSKNTFPQFVGQLGRYLIGKLDGRESAEEALINLASAGEAQLLCALLVLLHCPTIMNSSYANDVLETACTIAVRAERKHGASVHRLHLLAAGLSRHSELMNCLQSILATATISTADAMILAEHCTVEVPRGVLTNTRLLALVLDGLYNPSVKVKAASRAHLLQVLATIGAVCAHDDAGVSLLGVDEREAYLAELNARRSKLLLALEESQWLCEQNETTQIVTTCARLQALMHEETVARGVLLWARTNLTHPQLSAIFANKVQMPPLLALLVMMARRHSSIRSSVLQAWVQCLEISMPSESNALAVVELKRQVIDCTMVLLPLGQAVPVLNALNGWLVSSDLALIRHAIQRLLQLIAQPYSEDFVRRMLSMLSNPRTIEAFRCGRGDIVADFLQEVIKSMPQHELHAVELLREGWKG